MKCSVHLSDIFNPPQRKATEAGNIRTLRSFPNGTKVNVNFSSLLLFSSCALLKQDRSKNVENRVHDDSRCVR